MQYCHVIYLYYVVMAILTEDRWHLQSLVQPEYYYFKWRPLQHMSLDHSEGPEPLKSTSTTGAFKATTRILSIRKWIFSAKNGVICLSLLVFIISNNEKVSPSNSVVGNLCHAGLILPIKSFHLALQDKLKSNVSPKLAGILLNTPFINTNNQQKLVLIATS